MTYRLINLVFPEGIALLHQAYNWKAQMPGWYQAMASACPLTWEQFLEERSQPTYANFGVFDGDEMVSLIAFSALGNNDYEAHLISARLIGPDMIGNVAAELCDRMFTQMRARMIVTKTADCNTGMRGLLRTLGFAPTTSVEEGGIYRQHVILVRLWRRAV